MRMKKFGLWCWMGTSIALGAFFSETSWAVPRTNVAGTYADIGMRPLDWNEPAEKLGDGFAGEPEMG